MRLLAVTLLALTAFIPSALIARSGDVMPAPQKAPRTPVEKQSIKVINAQPMEYEGRATAIDGERIAVGGKEVRLFGIVTPSLSSNYGPQAKAKLEQLVQGKDVLCKVTARDGAGNPIAFCGTVNTPDISYEMLHQGWAMTDAKALKNNSLADVYGRVEQEAQAQNKGLFAPAPMTVTVPVSNPARAVMLPNPSAPIALEIAGGPQEAAKPNTAAAQPVKAEEAKVEAPKPEAKAEEPALGQKAPDELVIANLKETAPRRASNNGNSNSGNSGRGFIERYQQIIGSFIWLLAAAGFGGALLLRDRFRLKERRRMLAAALQGELTALRQICRTRSRELSRQRRIMDADAQPKPSQLWPRLRTAVYQAHAGSIGLLGSELSRQVSRIYGQCADYAAMGQGAAAQARQPSVQAVSESLSSLSDQIENALEALAIVEASGEPYVAELVQEDEFGMAVPESAVAPAQEANDAKKHMEKAAEVLAGLFKTRRAKTDEAARAEIETGDDVATTQTAAQEEKSAKDDAQQAA